MGGHEGRDLRDRLGHRAGGHDGQVAPDHGRNLAGAYRFLRRLENRVQMLRDAQTHALPGSDEDRQRLALALDYAGWDALQQDLAQCRAGVSAEFDALLKLGGRAR